MNTRERKEALELASHLRGTAKGKVAHAANLRESAANLTALAKKVPEPPEYAQRPGSFFEKLEIFLWGDEKRREREREREERERLETEAESYEAEAEKAEAAAVAAFAEADRLTERAIRGS